MSQKTTAELRAALNERQNSAAAELTKLGKLSARARMDVLFDEGTFVEVGGYINRKKTELDITSGEDFEPVVTGYGAIGGTLVFAFSQDFSRLKGALGEMHAKKICKIYEMALKAEAPIIGVFDSAGAKILEGVDALAGYGAIIQKASIAKNVIPQIAVISGPCGGSSAVIARMFDIIIVAKKSGSLYIAPETVLTDKTLGKPERLAKDGISAITAEDDAAALTEARKLIPHFGLEIPSNDEVTRLVDVSSILSNPTYDVHDVINTVVDAGSFVELYAEHAQHMVCGFATINSLVIGVVANNPAVKGGKLCPCSTDKASEFIDFCSEFQIPVLTLVDSEGVAMKDLAESKDLSLKLAKLAYSYTGGLSDKVTVVLGKAYGTAYTVMGSKELGVDVNLALDSAKIAAMSPERSVEFLGEVTDETKKSEIAADWADKFASPLTAAQNGYIDDIIDSSELRQRIATAFEMLAF
ncbi:MAG: methylmalonyl-CoA carboxyltransferase [Clostridia bacterium]|nr:methylmalonyl-CoA carboxyltransferase [Clostridia bacterium]